MKKNQYDPSINLGIVVKFSFQYQADLSELVTSIPPKIFRKSEIFCWFHFRMISEE